MAYFDLSRVTVEIFRVIPLIPLRIETEVVREGKRIQHVQAPVFDESGTLLAIGNVQRLRVADQRGIRAGHDA